LVRGAKFLRPTPAPPGTPPPHIMGGVGHHDRRHHTAPSGPTPGRWWLGGLGVLGAKRRRRRGDPSTAPAAKAQTPQASFGARRRGHRSSPDGGYRSPGAFLGSRLFRPLMREMLVAAHDASRLQFLRLSPQGDVLRAISRRTPGAMCYKTPGLLTASVVWPGAWRGPRRSAPAACSPCPPAAPPIT
jgi:MYXO-CTERM domain-containing protein